MDEKLMNDGSSVPTGNSAADRVDAWLDKREELLLGPYAARESASRGRESRLR